MNLITRQKSQFKIIASHTKRIEMIKRKENMPDITASKPTSIEYPLEKVGMKGVAIPIQVPQSNGSSLTLYAKAELKVNLDDPKSKGIHMSRLFTEATKKLKEKPLTHSHVLNLLASFIDSQKGLSSKAFITLSFEYPFERPALKSEYSGMRYYPVKLNLEYDANRKKSTLITEVVITYSSTCPCSAALSSQLIEEKLKQAFKDHPTPSFEEIAKWMGQPENIGATPHAQRSFATLKIKHAGPDDSAYLDNLIERIESTLKTPVQTAVKREDEQEFARLNAENLMFCEDAARRLKALFESLPNIADYKIHVSHEESLHAHDAEATTVKGVEGGFRV